MTQDKPSREWWIDIDDYTEAVIHDETGEIISTDAFVARKECPHDDAIHVVEHSAIARLTKERDEAKEHGRLCAERLYDKIKVVEKERDEARAQFKNFHRIICEAANYYHDETNWVRDQASLCEIVRIARAEVERLKEEQQDRLLESRNERRDE